MDGAAPIESVDQLVARFHAAGKPRAAWRIGVEHEKIGVLDNSTNDHRAERESQSESGDHVPYDGPRSILKILGELCAKHGFSPIQEGGHTIALARGVERITLEPGGQLELSGEPLAGAAQIQLEVARHLRELGDVSRELRIAWLAIGFRPFQTNDQIGWVPKGRYGVMREVLAKTGGRAHDMMKRTATVQANVDWSDEDDAARKLRCAMGASSIVTALFASSPLADGKDTGHQSWRAAAWLDTDPARCGLLPFAFEDGDLFRKYAEWALDVPMLFIHRGEGYEHSGGITFRRYLATGRPTLDEWDTHLSTMFPEARLKSYLETRGADSGSLEMVVALAALWKGLLYDEDACRAAIALTARMSFADRQTLRAEVPRAGLAAEPIKKGQLARELVAIARAGLARIAPDEQPFLAPLEEIARTGRTQADRIRELWKGDRAALISAFRY
jgi:glutamate--cysteine ligase